MTDEPPQSRERTKPKRSRLALWGWLATGAYCAAIAIFSSANWPEIAGMNPHDLSEMLAGIFAPLAFLWLVVGFYQQGQELKNSADALHIQAEELRNTVEQQRELVGVTRDQLRFEQEAHRQAAVDTELAHTPRFVLRYQGGNTKGEDREFSYTLFNAGGICTNVCISTADIERRRIPVMDRMAHDDVRLQFHDTENPVRDTEIRVTYLDGKNRPGEQRFMLKASGPYSFEIPGPFEEILFSDDPYDPDDAP